MVSEKEKEEKQKIEQDIIFDYCEGHPTCALAKINNEIGMDIAIKMLDLFRGKIISFPTQNALRRAVMPMTIRRYLFVVEKADSEEFKKRVKQLSKTYRLPKRAILEMNKSGRYVR